MIHSHKATLFHDLRSQREIWLHSSHGQAFRLFELCAAYLLKSKRWWHLMHARLLQLKYFLEIATPPANIDWMPYQNTFLFAMQNVHSKNHSTFQFWYWICEVHWWEAHFDWMFWQKYAQFSHQIVYNQLTVRLRIYEFSQSTMNPHGSYIHRKTVAYKFFFAAAYHYLWFTQSDVSVCR